MSGLRSGRGGMCTVRLDLSSGNIAICHMHHYEYLVACLLAHLEFVISSSSAGTMGMCLFGLALILPPGPG